MIVHLLYFAGLIVSLSLLPIVLVQAKRVKRPVPQLSEARRGIKGRVGVGQRTIKLIALGESTVAGVGVEDHADGFMGHVAKDTFAFNSPLIWQRESGN